MAFDPYLENGATGALSLVDRDSNQTTVGRMNCIALRRASNISSEPLLS